jgi:hypothetical protein
MTDQPSPKPAAEPARRRLVVVSGFGDDALTPRGQRTQQLIKVLGRDWDVELIAMPARDHRGGSGASGRSIARSLASRAVQELLFDRWEPWARRRFGRWRPEADAAVLVVAPWSPAAIASRRLRERGIPYVIDAGDPWAVGLRSRPRTIAGRRSLRAEAPIWEGAAGAILTTPQQAQRMSSIYPELPIMARPNGYEIPDGAPRPDASGREGGGSRTLRLAHFGVLYAARLDVVPFLARLQQSGSWDTVRFDQFGGDPDGMLNAAPPGIEVANHAAVPWPEVMARTNEFDAVVVLGNELGELLPSKAVQYLTLPVPRIAVTDTERDDAPTDPEAGRLVAEHVDRDWTAAELDPPPGDAWPAVAEELGAFVSQCVAGRSPERLTPAR